MVGMRFFLLLHLSLPPLGHKIDVNGVANDPWFTMLRRASGRDHVIFEIPNKVRDVLKCQSHLLGPSPK